MNDFLTLTGFSASLEPGGRVSSSRIEVVFNYLGRIEFIFADVLAKLPVFFQPVGFIGYFAYAVHPIHRPPYIGRSPLYGVASVGFDVRPQKIHPLGDTLEVNLVRVQFQP